MNQSPNMGAVRAVTARFPQISGVTKSTHDIDPIYGENTKVHPIYGGITLNRLIALSPVGFLVVYSPYAANLRLLGAFAGPNTTHPIEAIPFPANFVFRALWSETDTITGHLHLLVLRTHNQETHLR
jgi:hypothetical protein